MQGIISEDALTELQLAVLSELPDSFTTAEGVAIAGKCGMPERSFKRFLKDRKGVLSSVTLTETTPSYKHSPLGIFGTLAFLTEMPTSRLCQNVNCAKGKIKN
ncbi:hypothetical protein [Duncaniella muris]|uniref:hypothetical protein n=1 Tax=Duncaniella muris TaxID=2094150 RepID=UPI003F668DB9